MISQREEEINYWKEEMNKIEKKILDTNVMV